MTQTTCDVASFPVHAAFSSVRSMAFDPKEPGWERPVKAVFPERLVVPLEDGRRFEGMKMCQQCYRHTSFRHCRACSTNLCPRCYWNDHRVKRDNLGGRLHRSRSPHRGDANPASSGDDEPNSQASIRRAFR